MRKFNIISGLLLSILFIIYALEGVNESVIGPIFPHQARLQHSASYLSIGITLAMFPIGQIAISLVLGYVDVKSHLFFIFASGTLISGLSMLGFGIGDYFQNPVIYFIINCTNRFVNGCAHGCMVSTYYSLLIKLFGDVGAKSVTFFITFLYVGLSIGPYLGLKISDMTSYKGVFLVIFIVQSAVMIISCTLYKLLPKNEDESLGEDKPEEAIKEEKKLELYKNILGSPEIILFFGVTIYFNANIAYVEGTLADIMKSDWKSTEFQVELTYMIACAALVPSSLLAAFLTVRGYAFQILSLGIFQYSTTMILLYLLSTTNWVSPFPSIIIIMLLLNIPRGAAGSVLYAIVDMFCIHKFPDHEIKSIRSVLGPIMSIVFTLGHIVGNFVFIGIGREVVGYTWSLFFIICLGQILSILQFIVLARAKFLFSKHYVFTS